MERTLTAIATAWCVTPIVAYLCYLYFNPTTQSDSLLAGIVTVLAASIAFIATMTIVRQCVAGEKLRALQIADAIVFGVSTLVTWKMFR